MKAQPGGQQAEGGVGRQIAPQPPLLYQPWSEWAGEAAVLDEDKARE